MCLCAETRTVYSLVIDNGTDILQSLIASRTYLSHSSFYCYYSDLFSNEPETQNSSPNKWPRRTKTVTCRVITLA